MVSKHCNGVWLCYSPSIWVSDGYERELVPREDPRGSFFFDRTTWNATVMSRVTMGGAMTTGGGGGIGNGTNDGGCSCLA